MDMSGWRLVPIEFPFMMPEFPAMEGRFKSRPEDFVVDEELAYPACGDGNHLLVRVQKTGLSMEALLNRVRSTLGLSQSEIGYAGMKDRMSVSRQWLSLPRSAEANLERLESDDVKVLETAVHTNRLKIGHLKGNRFRILLRGARESKAGLVRTMLERMAADGVMNVYGKQRFGKDYESVRVGRNVVLGSMRISGMSRMKRRFVISSLQSYLFNSYALMRQKRGWQHKVLSGDVLKKRDTGGMFVADSPRREQARLDARELVITGPMFGKKMKRAEGKALELETEVLTKAGLNMYCFEPFHTLGAGTRRPLFVYPSEVSVEADGDGVAMSFFLPKGSYATVLVREIVKREVW